MTALSPSRRAAAGTLLVTVGAGLTALAGSQATANADPVLVPAPSPDRYVAIAYSPGTHIWGLSANKDNQAGRVAKNACAALAVDPRIRPPTLMRGSACSTAA